MPAKSHFATRQYLLSPAFCIAFDRLFPNINIMISYSVNQTALNNITGTIFCGTSEIRAASKPATVRDTNFIMVLKQECSACCRKREATPLLEQRLWLSASREAAGRRRTTGTEQLVYPGAGKSLTRKCILRYSGPEHCLVKYVVWGLHSNEFLSQGRQTRDQQSHLWVIYTYILRVYYKNYIKLLVVRCTNNGDF